MAGRQVKHGDGTRWMVRIMIFPFLMLIMGLIFVDLAGYFLIAVWMYVLLLMTLAILHYIKMVVVVFLEVFLKVKKTKIRLQGGKIVLDFLYKPEKKTDKL